jgi:HK97 family phage portal protein
MAFQTLGLEMEKRIAITLNSPAVPLGSPLAWEVLSGYGPSDADEMVTPNTAMQQATVNSCVRLISESIASMSPILYEREGNGKSEAFSNPLHNILALEPNPESSAFTMWQSFAASILLHGNGYLEIAKDGVGNVTGLWFLPPTQVQPTRDTADGSLYYRVFQGLNVTHYRKLLPRQIIHVPAGFSIDGVTGISVLSQARNAIGGGIAMDRFANRYFANSAMPSLAITTSKVVKAEDKMSMRRDWEMMHSRQNQHKLAVLDSDTDLKVLSIPNSDSQFLESRQLSREEICGLFGVKPSQIGDTARVAGETFSGQQLTFLTDTLNPWLQKIRQEITRKLLSGRPDLSVVHDTSDRLKLDVESQMKAFAVSMQWGILTANDCRKQLGLDPGPASCDVHLVAANMMDSDRLLTVPTATTIREVVNE